MLLITWTKALMIGGALLKWPKYFLSPIPEGAAGLRSLYSLSWGRRTVLC
jgi:hypothetical protein